MAVEVCEIIEAAGGEIVGKIRLQKMVYLLDQLGLGSGYSFDYHHYGPYSSELADRTNLDVLFDCVVEESQRRFSDGVPYSVFKLPGSYEPSGADGIGGIPEAKIKGFVSLLQAQSGTVLELAATIHWLAFVEKVEDWRNELIQRKASKADGGRTDKAIDLLKQLGIAPV